VIERWQKLRSELEPAFASGAPISDARVRAWVAAMGRLQVGVVMRLGAAVWSVARARGDAAPTDAALHSLYRRMQATAFRDAIDLGSLAADGDDLRRAGIPPGPGLGKILQALLVAVIDDPSKNTTDWLLQEAKRLHESAPASGDVGTDGQMRRPN
jgi:hypothetical protein